MVLGLSIAAIRRNFTFGQSRELDMQGQKIDARTDPLLERLIGQYRLVQLIGIGAMARVYRAQDTAAGDAEVAVKILSDTIALDPNHRRRFKREAETVQNLDHPYILPILTFGEDDDVLFTVMPLIRGRTLVEHLRRYGALPPEQVARIASQIGDALDYAHQQGVVHRDIKPHNIMMVSPQQIALADFGLAKLSDEMTRLTASGTILGSPAYMSPEQARGGIVDHRADIYSLGIVLYECLLGRLPYSAGTTMEVIGQHLTALPLSPQRINRKFPTRIADVLLKSLEKDPDDRFASAGDLAIALNRAIGSLPAPADLLVSPEQIEASTEFANHPATIVLSRKTSQAMQRRRVVVVLLLLLLISALGVVFFRQVVTPLQARAQEVEATARALSSQVPVVITQLVTNAAGEPAVIIVTQLATVQAGAQQGATPTVLSTRTPTPLALPTATATDQPTATSSPQPTATVIIVVPTSATSDGSTADGGASTGGDGGGVTPPPGVTSGGTGATTGGATTAGTGGATTAGTGGATTAGTGAATTAGNNSGNAGGNNGGNAGGSGNGGGGPP
jgi:serine/threonine protein kinase